MAQLTDTSGMTKFDRQTIIMSLIKDSGSSGVRPKELLSLFSSRATLSRDLNELIEKGKIRRTGKTGASVYFYIDRNKNLEDRSDRNLENGKNSEGYSDPTASAAIKEVDKTIRLVDLIPGSIVEHRTAVGDIYDYLVLNSYGDSATGLRLCEAWADSGEHPWSIEVHSRNKRYFANISRISTVPVKFLSPSRERLDTDFDSIKEKISDYLGIIGKTVEIEKIVEKEVKLPVESDTSNDVLKLETRIKVLEAQIKVYKEAFSAFGCGNKGVNIYG